MNCPNCNFENIGNPNTCENCGVDMVLFDKTSRMSDVLYNRGLSQAKLNDLSGAIDILTKSIEFNKNNVNARNLLGLVYFEVGHIGDALKHWVISSSLLKEKNPAKRYIELIQKSNRALEKYNDAIKMYNQALSYIKQKSDDMAIIQLKKAVELSPKFVDAMNLLVLCYLIQKDKEKAQALIERVLTIDINNSVALNYYKELSTGKARPEPVHIKSKRAAPAIQQASGPSYSALTAKDKKSFGESFHVAEILSFVIGAVCAFAILYILWMPAAIQDKEQELSQLKTTSTAQEQSYKEIIASNNTKIEELETANAQLKQTADTLNAQALLQDRIQKVTSASALYSNGNVEDAANMVHSMDITGLPVDILEKVNNLKAEAYPAAAKKYYDAGVSFYNAGSNEEAKTSLEKSLVFISDNDNFKDGVIYYLGIISEENGDIENAKKYYDTVINDYPRSKWLSKAKTRRNRL